MRLTIIAAALTLALGGGAIAQRAAPQADTPIFSADRFRAHVAFLSDDRLEGRGTGTRGHEIAAAYVASQFMGLGLKPGGENGGWFQQVPFRSASLKGKAVASIAGRTGTRSWEHGTDMLIRPSLVEQKLDVTAPVVFVGYGVDAPDQGMDDYRGLDVRGKIVVMLGGVPRNLPSEIAAHLNDTKAAMAARHGAIGVVTLYTSELARVRPWEGRIAAAARPVLAWLDKAGKPDEEAPGLRFDITFDDAAAASLFEGSRSSYALVRAEADRPNTHPRGFPLAATLSVRSESEWTAITSPEVIGLLPGSDPVLKDEYVVLMGHLDHLGMKSGAAPGEDSVYNGALDNASGVATMIEAARAFSETGQRPRRSILFIANTAEEKGLLGADYLANHPTVPIGRIAGVVDLDMPLLLYDFTDVIAFGADHSTLARTVAEAAGTMGVKLAPDPMPEQNIFVRSDHYMFVRKGVPAVFLATGWSNGGGAQWDHFLTETYHRVNDDMSQPINWDAGAKFARLNFLISRELANADSRPRWYKGDYFGDLFAPGGARAAR